MPEAQGTRPPVNWSGVSQSSYVTLLQEPQSWAPAAMTGVKAGRPLHKLEPYDGSESLDTFLLKFRRMADYLRWDEEDTFHHLCASLRGAARQVLWDVRSHETTTDVVRLV